jgi:hypothetical protein
MSGSSATGISNSNAARESASFLTSRSFKALPDMGRV